MKQSFSLKTVLTMKIISHLVLFPKIFLNDKLYEAFDVDLIALLLNIYIRNHCFVTSIRLIDVRI